MEWGIANPTDQYIFQIDAGQLSIIRRSTVPLETSVLERNGLTIADQEQVVGGDPTDSENIGLLNYLEITTGDPLNGNGPSGYLIQPNRVTMYKIEFGLVWCNRCQVLCIYPRNGGHDGLQFILLFLKTL